MQYAHQAASTRVPETLSQQKSMTHRVQISSALALLLTAYTHTATASEASNAPTHCKPPEKVVFSCSFKNRKTVSLCASPDLSRDNGTMQYRYGVVGNKVELEYPQLGEWGGAQYEHPSRRFSFSFRRNYSPSPRSDATLDFGPYPDVDASISFHIDVRRHLNSGLLDYAKLYVLQHKRTTLRSECESDSVDDRLESLRSVFPE